MTLEKACLQHCADELRYQQSTKARNDRAADIARRQTLDRKLGHSPRCGLLKCAPDCKKAK